MNLLCWLNIHRYRPAYVGTSWQDDWVSACTRCGQENSRA